MANRYPNDGYGQHHVAQDFEESISLSWRPHSPTPHINARRPMPTQSLALHYCGVNRLCCFWDISGESMASERRHIVWTLDDNLWHLLQVCREACV
jgi:hypothetical protein